MRLTLLALLLIALAAPCAASPLLFLMQGGCNPANSINCITSVQSGGVEDTGTETRCMNSGDTLTLYAACSAGPGNQSDMLLYINGVATRGASCNNSATFTNASWSAPATACYTVRIAGTLDQPGVDTFLGNSFVIPGTIP